MRAFGGKVMDGAYWGKECASYTAWYVVMTYGGVSYYYKTTAGSVRAVAPVPVASAR